MQTLHRKVGLEQPAKETLVKRQLIPEEQTVFLPVFLWQVVPNLPSYAVSAHINNPTTALPVMEAGLSSLKSTGADENRHAKC